jgi:hypothetical protein
VSWRERYDVWLQVRGRDGDDRGYAAACLTCPPPNGMGQLWLCSTAGSNKEAWDVCKKHEAEVHNGGV